MTKHRYVRLVMLVREGINVKIHNELMHEDVAVIWASVGDGKSKILKIGGIYREHHVLLKQKPNPTLADSAQLVRWTQFLAVWKRAAKDDECILIRDTNLEYILWHNPEPSHSKMVQKTKEEIKTEGFYQVIRGISRTWRQTD